MKNVDKQVDRMVKDWYASNAHHEWRRLQQDPYHQLEFKVTMRFLEKYLPRRGTILDAGGGPGRYSIELARQGYRIVLLDLVPEMLKIARREMRKAGVLAKSASSFRVLWRTCRFFLTRHLMQCYVWGDL